MSSLTGVLYAILLAYLGGWYTGYWSGNFSLLLFILTLATFVFWLAERFHFAPRRAAAGPSTWCSTTSSATEAASPDQKNV